MPATDASCMTSTCSLRQPADSTGVQMPITMPLMAKVRPYRDDQTKPDMLPAPTVGTLGEKGEAGLLSQVTGKGGPRRRAGLPVQVDYRQLDRVGQGQGSQGAANAADRQGGPRGDRDVGAGLKVARQHGGQLRRRRRKHGALESARRPGGE